MIAITQTSNKRSILLLLLVLLLLFGIAGFLIISYFDTYYYTEKMQEARILAQTYATTLETTLDARTLLTEQFHTKLRVAGSIASKQEEPYSNEMLADLATTLDIDVFYLYDSEGRVEYSSDTLYRGWIAPQGHPVRTFMESGADLYIDDIRTDSETETYWLYSYHRFGEGRIIQSGILAEKLAALYEKLQEQWIIDQISKESPVLHIAFINQENIITASSIASEIGERGADTSASYLPDQNFFRSSFTGSAFDWSLKVHLPIHRKGELFGTLALLFDLTSSRKLILLISITILGTLVILFLLFSFTIINIAKKNRQIFTTAFFDEVTRLPNVNYLKKVLHKAEYKEMALIIINPLHFRFINLVYGYSYGDTLLYQIASSIQSISMEGVALQAYRFSDDQFIITAYHYNSTATLFSLCESILALFERSKVLSSIDCTFGIVEGTKGGIDFDTLIKKASIAVHAATKTDRIQLYSKSIEEQIVRQDTIEKELKRVVAGEPDMLTLLYQPIVDAQTGAIISFEALARLSSRSLGTVSPVEFIAIAEERHLIAPLGKIILQQATLFIQKLTSCGFDSYPIAVNVSAFQLLDDSFVATIEEILTTTAIKPEQLEIELTESVFSNTIDVLNREIGKIHALGIQIAIDDFGTGFSSLNRLRGLEVDTVKLDKQFVDKLEESDGIGISSDIISMAHHLGKTVIAEGVEREEQREILVSMGCDAMQGYLFSKPVTEDDVITLLERQGGDT